MAIALMTHHEKRAWAEETPDRPISNAHKLRSKIAGHKATRNLAKSTAQYAATMEAEEKTRQEKGVFLEFKWGIYSEPICRYAAIANLFKGQLLWFSNQDINRLVLGLEMEITWQDEGKGVYRLADDDKKTRLFFIRKDGQFLKIGLMQERSK